MNPEAAKAIVHSITGVPADAQDFAVSTAWDLGHTLIAACRTLDPDTYGEDGRSTKRPLHQNALDAYLRGELRPLGRAATVRPESDYEQDPSQVERVMLDEPVRRSRRGYRS